MRAGVHGENLASDVTTSLPLTRRAHEYPPRINLTDAPLLRRMFAATGAHWSSGHLLFFGLLVGPALADHAETWGGAAEGVTAGLLSINNFPFSNRVWEPPKSAP